MGQSIATEETLRGTTPVEERTAAGRGREPPSTRRLVEIDTSSRDAPNVRGVSGRNVYLDDPTASGMATPAKRTTNTRAGYSDEAAGAATTSTGGGKIAPRRVATQSMSAESSSGSPFTRGIGTVSAFAAAR